MKVKGKKLKRWPKHCSSVSNPSERRFREAAKNRFFKPSGPSALTVEALQKHDGEAELDVDSEHFDAKTFNTWATNFTNCTNVTFSRVHRLWNSNNSVHKAILALLASLTEIIKERGGTGTETEYFCALISYLESDSSVEEEATAAAVLLNLAVKKVPATALKSRFSDISKGLLGFIIKHADSESVSLLKSLLLSLAFVLRAQEAASWSLSYTKNAFKVLLDFVLHKKPRVRKAAQQAVKIVLKSSLFLSQPDPPPYHPAAVLTSEFCVATIEQKGGKPGAAETADTLHTVDLLQDVMVTFPQKHIEKSCNTILRIMTVSKPVVTEHGMKALHGLFIQQPSSPSLPAEVNAQIINALHDFKPEENDSGLMPIWLTLMGQAHLNLSRLDMNLCLGHLPKLFSVAMTCLLSHHKNIRNTGTSIINMLLKECIGAETDLLAGQMQGVKTDSLETPLHKVIRAMETGLSYQFSRNWDLVFQLLATMMEVLGKICPDLLKKCLRSMADLCDSISFDHKTAVNLAVGKAVKSMGPRQVIDAVPLKITGREENPDLSRSWLLPVIRDNVSDTEISFFANFFLPLAFRFRQKAHELTEQKKLVAAKTYETMELQIWSMIRGFSTRPVDLAKSFDKKLAQMLGKTLSERPELLLDILAALRALVTFSKSNEEDKATMAKFAKNYLPILFNLFTVSPDNPRDSQRLAMLETVKVYLTITESKCVHDLLDNCFSKLEEKNITTFRKIALVDLAVVMVNYADEQRLSRLYKLTEENIKAADKTVQKKAYRLLEEICACQSDTCRQFVLSNITQLQQLLLSSLSASAPSTKNPRLRCLASICQQLTESNTAFLQAVLPEAVQCTRGVGERARVAAYHLIVVVAQTLMRWNPDVEEQDLLSEYVNWLVAGLSGSPEMISATLLALTRIFFHFKGRLSGNTISEVMQMVCLLLASEKRVIVISALDFIKTLVGAYSQETICAYLPEMILGLASLKTQTKQHCHFRVKHILRKLMKKFGYETVFKMAPQSLHKVIQKAHSELKQEQKKKEKKAQDTESEEEEEPVLKEKPETVEEILQDSDLDEEEETSLALKTKSRKEGHRQAWIKEGEEDITDFMDVSAAKKVMASKPKTKADKIEEKRTDTDVFKIAPDGRLIITEPKDDQGEKIDLDEEEDLDDLQTALEGGSEKKRRKRLRDAAKHTIDDEPPMKYKAGGSGIHRPLQQKKTNYGVEYKAKKAGGDIKKVGKHDPYAYVPLNFANLNKRKQAKLKGQFAGLVKGARKGALKARKGKGRQPSQAFQ